MVKPSRAQGSSLSFYLLTLNILKTKMCIKAYLFLKARRFSPGFQHQYASHLCLRLLYGHPTWCVSRTTSALSLVLWMRLAAFNRKKTRIEHLGKQTSKHKSRKETHLMRSMVLRADPQTMSNTIDRVWVCCFCILAHFGQTTKHFFK